MNAPIEKPVRIVLAALAALPLAALLFGGACAPLPPETAANTATAGLAGSADITGAEVGYLVTDLDTGATVAAANADKAFIPASTLKVVTALAALETLGPGHRFNTSVHVSDETSGKLTADGTLKGDLWLKGGGDPLLAVQDLLALAQQLRDGGLKRVSGRFLYDESALQPAPQIAPAQPHAAPYNPAVSALSLDFNRVELNWRSDAPAGRHLFMAPALGTIAPVLSEHAMAPGEGGAAIAGANGEAWQVDAGQLPGTDGSAALPVKAPARRTAAVFRALAGNLGIELPPAEAGAAPAGSRPVAALVSAPLIDTLRPAFRYSNNLVSELIGRAASHRIAGRALDTRASAAAIGAWLTKRVSGTDWNALRMRNHSGLSAESRITPRQMNAVMTAALKARYGGWSFAALLPTGGWDHALAGLFAEPRFNGRVWAKSGTMHYTKGLTGLLFTASGKRLAFALYITDFKRRRAYDADPARLAPATQADARAWIEGAETHMEALVGGWIAGD